MKRETEKLAAALILSGFSLAGGLLFAAEFEVLDKFSVDGYTVLRGSADIPGGSFAVGGSTLVVKAGNIGIGTTAPNSALDIGGTSNSMFLQNLAAWGLNARDQGLLIMPEGSVIDDGAGNLTFGSTVIIMNPLSGSYERVTAGTYALGSWGSLWAPIPPTGTQGGSVAPTVLAWSDGAHNYDGRDRILLAQRMSNGRIMTRFGNFANLTGTAGQYLMNGSVGIGTTGPGYKLDVQGGDINASGNLREAGAALSGKYAYTGGINASGTWPISITGTSAGAAPTGPAGGDLTGSYPNPAFDLGLGHTWTAAQTFNGGAGFPGSGIWNASGNVGIGLTSPSAKLHIRGADPQFLLTSANDSAYQAGLQVFWNSNHQMSLTGLSGSEVLGQYAANTALQYGNIGIGTTAPSAKLSLTATGTELRGAAASSTLKTMTGTLGTTGGNRLKLASIGFDSGNQSSLGIEALRTANGTSWFTTAIGLKIDVDNTSPVNNAQIWLTADGNVGIGTTAPGAALQVGSSFQVSAAGTLTGAAGNISMWTNNSGYITSAGRAYPRRSDGTDLNLLWSAQSGQPTYLWGGSDGSNMYIYNPSNFNVNYANSAGNADTTDGYHLNQAVTSGANPQWGTTYINGMQILEKGGNNGSVSCNTFCQGSNWGAWAGSCVAAICSGGTGATCDTICNSIGQAVRCLCMRL